MKLYAYKNSLGTFLNQRNTNNSSIVEIDKESDEFQDLIMNKVDKGKRYYNIGDMLGMPLFRIKTFEGGDKKHFAKRWNFFNEGRFTNSIGHNYYSSFDNNKIENICHPNKERIIKATDKFVLDNNIESELENICTDKTLIVHCRSGDKGIIAARDLPRAVKKLEESYSLEKIIVIMGCHNISECKHVKKMGGFNKILGNFVKAIECMASISDKVEFFFAEPDVHISLMRHAKYLKVSSGGFTLIGKIVNKYKIL